MTTLNLTEIFTSIQGETSLCGLPTTFVRLSQCNLRCSWCDTSYSFSRGSPVAIQEIITQVERAGTRHVCITGGEPLLQAGVHSLMSRLCDLGFSLSIETGGSLKIQTIDPRVKVILDVKCPGSDMHEKNHWENLPLIQKKDEVKFVVADRQDYDYAMDVCQRYQLFDKAGEILLSPVFGELDSQELVGWITADKLPVRLNLQMHKFIWTPETQGV